MDFSSSDILRVLFCENDTGGLGMELGMRAHDQQTNSVIPAQGGKSRDNREKARNQEMLRVPFEPQQKEAVRLS
jgi:hypothetical protein